MEVHPLHFLTEELETCRLRLAACFERIDSIEGIQIDRILDSFIDGVKEDLERSRCDNQIARAISAPHVYAERLCEYDLFCLDGVAPEIWTNLAAWPEQESQSSHVSHSHKASTSALPQLASSQDRNVLHHLGGFSSIRHDTQSDIARSLVASSSVGCPVISPRLRVLDLDTSLKHSGRATNNENCSMEKDRMSPPRQQGRELSKLMDNDFEMVASSFVFQEFCDAVRYMRCGQVLRLPAADAQPITVVEFLDRAQGASFACEICRRMGLWRLKVSYTRLKDKFLDNRATMRTSEKRATKKGKSSSQALRILVQNSRRMAVPHRGQSHSDDDEQLKARMHRFLSSARSWSILCRNVSSGILCLIPQVPPSRFERIREEHVDEFAQSLKHAQEGKLMTLAEILSPHLEAILEGQDCRLAAMIENDSVTAWNDVLALHAQLTTCLHQKDSNYPDV